MRKVIQEYFGDISRRPADMTLIAQQRHWERIMELIDPAKVVIEERGCDNLLHCPTVLDGVSGRMKSCKRRFGPCCPC